QTGVWVGADAPSTPSRSEFGGSHGALRTPPRTRRPGLHSPKRLFREPVSLSHCADGYGVIDVQPSGIESLAIEFQQGGVLHLRFENLHGRFRSEALRF